MPARHLYGFSAHVSSDRRPSRGDRRRANYGTGDEGSAGNVLC